MSAHAPNLASLLDWDDGLPHLKPDLLDAWIESQDDPDEAWDTWNQVLRQYLVELAAELGKGYHVAESECFLALAWNADPQGDSLLSFAEGCRQQLLSSYAGVAAFDLPGKQMLVALRTPEDYYRYISHYYSEGEFGGSSGCHIRAGYPHIALQGTLMTMLDCTLAHELTHASLLHLSMPQWLEEGLTQMAEHDMAGRSPLMVDSQLASRHKRHWGNNGLDEFWFGTGFSRSGQVQKLSYELAEILGMLLADEARPRWFGLVREPQRRYLAFLQNARREDCGESASTEHLGFPLADLAAQFLGPGNWSPSL